MTTLLERAIAEASGRPEAEQDALAARMLAELGDETKWDRSFASTTDDQWDKLAALARRDIASSGSSTLDDLIAGERG